MFWTVAVWCAVGLACYRLFWEAVYEFDAAIHVSERAWATAWD